ncbi:MAG: DUF721 domain-containing protein [Bacteroidota bacterium]
MARSYLSLGDAIQAFLKKYNLKDEADIQKVILEWEQLMGKPIAQRTDKLYLRGKTFCVHIPDPVWRQELQMARGKIKDTINRRVGRTLVEDVRILA